MGKRAWDSEWHEQLQSLNFEKMPMRRKAKAGLHQHSTIIMMARGERRFIGTATVSKQSTAAGQQQV